MTTHPNPDPNPRSGSAAAGSLTITTGGIIATILLAIVVAVCVRLGFWQLARLDERRTLNAGIATRLEQRPIGDIAALTDTSGVSYRAASARGVFDNVRYIVLPGRSHRGVPGVHLIAPLRLAGRTDALLVNRGWVPSPDAATIDGSDFAVLDSVHIRGLVLPFPGTPQSLAQRGSPVQTDSFRHVWFTVDERALRDQFPYELADVMLQELAVAQGPGYPAKLDPPPLDEGPHLGYALQWFSFALIGVIGWFALVFHSRAKAK